MLRNIILVCMRWIQDLLCLLLLFQCWVEPSCSYLRHSCRCTTVAAAWAKHARLTFVGCSTVLQIIIWLSKQSTVLQIIIWLSKHGTTWGLFCNWLLIVYAVFFRSCYSNPATIGVCINLIQWFLWCFGWYRTSVVTAGCCSVGLNLLVPASQCVTEFPIAIIILCSFSTGTIFRKGQSALVKHLA